MNHTGIRPKTHYTLEFCNGFNAKLLFFEHCSTLLTKLNVHIDPLQKRKSLLDILITIILLRITTLCLLERDSGSFVVTMV